MNNAGLVILTYNNSELVKGLVDSILGDMPFKYVVIVDNCSADNTFEILNRMYKNNDRVVVLCSPVNGGYAKGNNVGGQWLVENTNVEYIFFANPDVLFESECVDYLCNEMTRGEYSVLAPVMYKPDGAVDDENYWDEPTCASELLNFFYMYRMITKSSKKKAIDFNKRVMEVFAVTGSFFCIEKNTYKEIGGFDENTFLFCEENILGLKLKRVGKKTGILTKIKYIHNHSTIIDSNVDKVRKFEIYMDSRKYYFKNYLSSNRFLNGLFDALDWIRRKEVRVLYNIIKKG